ncbi:MAG: YqaJ viral recombinase family protein [Bacteroidales bacterium]|nr:YqaJ viral recombinase family protein [Bacteroidales bacterium]
MSTTIIRPATREEWLELRKSGMGSSEVASIVGLNPWQTPYQLWRKKLGMDEPTEENQAMKRGHWCEDAVAQYWSDTTGRQVIARSAGDWLIRDDERPFLQVSPDRTFWVDGDGLKHGKNAEQNKGILECKTTNLVIDPNDIPKHWFCQVQYQLAVAGYQHGSLAWMMAGFQFGHIDIDVVPDFASWLISEVERFWTDNVLGKKEPEAINVQDVLAKYAKHTEGKSIEISDEVMQSVLDLKEVKKEIAALDERKAALEEQVKLAMGDAEAITYQGQTVATWKAPKAGVKFNEKLFKAENEQLWKQYAEPSQGARRFLIK